jgi:hypothetical protein
MSKRVTKVDPAQQSIQSLFAKKAPVKKDSAAIELGQIETKQKSDTLLVSSDPLVQEFYDSLGEKERRAHVIALEKLGTSYDVVRTHGFLNWKKSRK